jgi:hypothetical protein
MNQLLEIGVFPDDFQSSSSAPRDLDFVEFGLRSLKHIIAKSPFPVARVLALDPIAMGRELFALDFLMVLVLLNRFVRQLCDEEAGCRFVVETPTFAAVCGAKMDTIMPNIGPFIADSFFADDPALLTTVRALDRVIMREAMNGWAKRQWMTHFLQNIVPHLKEIAQAADGPTPTMIQRLHHDYRALLDEFDEGS